MIKKVIYCLIIYLSIMAVRSYSLEGLVETNVYIKTRYLLSQQIPHSFQLTEAVFQNRWNPVEHVGSYFEVYFYPETADVLVKELYGEIKNFPEFGSAAKGKLIVGKARNFCFGLAPTIETRKTSDYGIVADFLTRRRVTGLQYLLDYGQLNVNFGLFNGYEIETRSYGTEGVLLVFDELLTENNDNKEVSIRFSVKASEGCELGLSISSAELAGNDLLALNSFLGADFISRSCSAVGMDYSYKREKYSIQGGIVNTSISSLEAMAYEALGGLEHGKAEIYLRIGYITYKGIEPDKNLAATWDKLQITPSFKYRINENCWLQIESNLNSEKEPSLADALENNELFAELYIGF